jgi:hypothetical protein
MAGLIIGSSFLVFEGLDKYYTGLGNLVPVALGIAGVFLFSGTLLLGLGSFLSKKPAGSAPAQPTALPPGEATNKLPPERPAPTVTERTTDLLEATQAPAAIPPVD